MTKPNLQNLGWKPFFERQIDRDDSTSVIIARISAHHGSEVLLLGESGEFRLPVRVAQYAGDIAVGDWLVVNAARDRTLQRLERTSLLLRKDSGEEVKPQVIAANIDTVFIVTSCNDEFNLSRIERYLALALQCDVTPVVVLTKSDLCDDPAALREQAEQLHADLPVLTLDARNPDDVEVLRKWCGPGESVALLGSSGVGKSTLANALCESNQDTGAIREQDGKGRHTTTARSLHLIPGGGVLVDNPGIRELQLPACDDGITDLFEDIEQLATACKFNNCSHEGDAGCAIAAAIESGELDERRWTSYQKLSAEQERNAQSLAERRERFRKTGKMYKSTIAAKRRRQDR